MILSRPAKVEDKVGPQLQLQLQLHALHVALYVILRNGFVSLGKDKTEWKKAIMCSLSIVQPDQPIDWDLIINAVLE